MTWRQDLATNAAPLPVYTGKKTFRYSDLHNAPSAAQIALAPVQSCARSQSTVDVYSTAPSGYANSDVYRSIEVPLKSGPKPSDPARFKFKTDMQSSHLNTAVANKNVTKSFDVRRHTVDVGEKSRQLKTVLETSGQVVNKSFQATGDVYGGGLPRSISMAKDLNSTDRNRFSYMDNAPINVVHGHKTFRNRGATGGAAHDIQKPEQRQTMKDQVNGGMAWPAFRNISEMTYHTGKNRTYIQPWKNQDGKRNTHADQTFATAKKEMNRVSHLEVSDWKKDQNNKTSHGSDWKGQFYKKGKGNRKTFTDDVMDFHKKYKFPAPSQYQNKALTTLSHHIDGTFGKSDQQVKHLQLITDTVTHSKCIPAPSKYDPEKSFRQTKPGQISYKWQKPDASAEERVNGKIKRTEVGPGTYRDVSPDMHKNRANRQPATKDNMLHDHYVWKENKHKLAASQYFKETGHAKQIEKCLSKSPPHMRTKRH